MTRSSFTAQILAWGPNEHYVTLPERRGVVKYGAMNGPIALPVLPTVSLSQQTAICSQQCKARCCKYIIVKIPAPRTKADHEEIRWWVAHQGISVHIAQRKWYLQIFTQCGYLTPNHLCGAYENRPEVCRDYDPSNCEFTGELDIEREFHTMEEYDRYLEEQRRQQRTAFPRSSRRRNGRENQSRRRSAS